MIRVELAVVEALIGFFLVMPLLRPFVRLFAASDGFVFFPPAALLCAIAVIPAYGFRPECVPLLIYAVLFNFMNLKALFAVFLRLKISDGEGRNVVRLCICALSLSLCMGLAFKFLPAPELGMSEDEQNDVGQNAHVLSDAETGFFKLHDAERNADLFVRYYPAALSQNDNGAVILFPPLAVPHIPKKIISRLLENGMSVIILTHPFSDSVVDDGNGADTKASLLVRARNAMLLVSGMRDAKRVGEGRALVAERLSDLRFFLNAIKQGEINFSRGNFSQLFFLGYNEGGAAMVEFLSNRNELRIFPEIKGAAVIESVMLSGVTAPENTGAPENTKRFIFTPNTETPEIGAVPHSLLPVLFIAGDSIIAGKNRYGRYVAVLQELLESPSPFIIAAVKGAHHIDFTGLKNDYPVLELDFKGEMEENEGNNFWKNDTGALMDGISKIITAFYVAAASRDVENGARDWARTLQASLPEVAVEISVEKSVTPPREAAQKTQ
jgi:hypothetical protein